MNFSERAGPAYAVDVILWKSNSNSLEDHDAEKSVTSPMLVI